MRCSIHALQLCDLGAYIAVLQHRAGPFLKAYGIDAGGDALLRRIADQEHHRKRKDRNTAANDSREQDRCFLYRNGFFKFIGIPFCTGSNGLVVPANAVAVKRRRSRSLRHDRGIAVAQVNGHR